MQCGYCHAHRLAWTRPDRHGAARTIRDGKPPTCATAIRAGFGDQPGARAVRALERERAAERLDPVGEAAQAAALAVGAADSVVRDLDEEVTVVASARTTIALAPACFCTLAIASATT